MEFDRFFSMFSYVFPYDVPRCPTTFGPQTRRRAVVQHGVHVDLHVGPLAALDHRREAALVAAAAREVVAHGLVAGPPGRALDMLLALLEFRWFKGLFMSFSSMFVGFF